jgi:hypothetical protein
MPTFGEWRPDLFDLNAPLLRTASGVLPGENGYEPWQGLTAFMTNALPAACLGAIMARKEDGSFTIFAGTAVRLYKFDSATTAWTNVTRTVGGNYTVPADSYWSFAQFGDTLYAAQIGDAMQSIDIGSGANFAAVAGAPQGAYLRVVGDQLMVAGVAAAPNTLYWSGTNDPTFWTIGQRNCDTQTFPDGGVITGLTPLEVGLIFQEGAVRRFAAVPDRRLFEFGLVDGSRGCIAPQSLTILGSMAFYLSNDGWYATGGGASNAIGEGKIDRWFQDLLNRDRLGAIIGAADPRRRRVFFAFPSSGNSGSELDVLICFDLATQRWTYTEDIDTAFIFPAATPGLTLEGLDAISSSLDALPYSLDAGFLRGGAPQLAGFNSTDKLCFFNGDNLAALIETGDVMTKPGTRYFVRGVSMLTDADSVMVQVGTKERVQDSISWRSSQALNSQGIAPTRASGRVHRVRATIPAAEAWGSLQGFESDAVPEGRR